MRHQVDYSEDLAELMRDITRNRSQRQLARDARLSPATIGNMLLGRVPSREVCARVGEAAGLPVARLLRAAGYDLPDAVTAVQHALEAVEGLSVEHKKAICEIVRSISEECPSVSGTVDTELLEVNGAHIIIVGTQPGPIPEPVRRRARQLAESRRKRESPAE